MTVTSYLNLYSRAYRGYTDQVGPLLSLQQHRLFGQAVSIIWLREPLRCLKKVVDCRQLRNAEEVYHGRNACRLCSRKA